jgi:DNA-binding beta-propeller fold protein YncE
MRRIAAGVLVACLAAASPAAGSVYVANNGQGTVSTFSTDGSGALSMLGSPASSGSGANQLAISPNGSYLYATNASGGTVSAFSIGASGALTAIGAPVMTGSGTGSNPAGVATSPDGRHLYVANNAQGTVAAFSIGPGGALSAIGAPVTSGTSTSSAPYSPIVSPSGKYLYVTNGNQTSISTFAIASDGSLTQVGAPAGTIVGIPSGIAESPDGNNLFVAEDGGIGTIGAFTIGTDGRPVPNGEPVEAGGAGPAYLAVSPNGSHLYASVQGPGDIATFSIGPDGKLAMVGSPLHSGATADGIAVSPSGRNVYMANNGDGTVAAFTLGASGVPTALGTPVNSGSGPGSGADGVAITPDTGPTAAFTTSGNATRTFNAVSSTAGSVPIASYVWAFGDGASASGISVTHTYARPGTYTATLTVTGSDGCSISGPFAGQTAFCRPDAAASISVPQVVALSTPAPTPPSLTNVSQSSARWREGAKLVQISRRKRRAPVGTTFSFSLNEPAVVTMSFTRAAVGREVGHRCVARTHRNASHKSCKRMVPAGSLTLAGHSGANRVIFQGRLSRSSKLKRGRYTVTITATNSARQKSPAHSLSFTIVG